MGSPLEPLSKESSLAMSSGTMLKLYTWPLEIIREGCDDLGSGTYLMLYLRHQIAPLTRDVANVFTLFAWTSESQSGQNLCCTDEHIDEDLLVWKCNKYGVTDHLCDHGVVHGTSDEG
jgi:hypothetical protein